MTEPGPVVVVLAGPNGAGKTTSARAFLAKRLSLLTYVNADVIAEGLSGFNPESSAVEAGRIMWNRLRSLANRRADFAFETTLAGQAHARFLNVLRASGYTIHLVYFWLSSADLAVARVAERVRRGGHGVPEDVIRSRYARRFGNFFTPYRPLTELWEVYDNSSAGVSRPIAYGDHFGHESVIADPTWREMRQQCLPT